MKRETLTQWLHEGLLLLALAAILVLPRALQLNKYVFIDETYYLKHSAQFYWAMANQEYDQTDLVVHPGVIPHWLGAAAVRQLFPDFAGAQDEQKLGDMTFRNLLNDRDLDLITLLVWARRFVVVFNSTLLVLAYLLARRLFPTWLAVLGTLLAGFDPFFFDHSRFLHVDGMLTALMFVSLLAFLSYLNEGKLIYLLLSAGTAGMGVLTKVPALVLLGFIGLFSLIEWFWPKDQRFTPKRSWKGIIKLSGVVAIWIVVLVAVIFVLWPAMWSDPFTKLGHIAGFVVDQGGAEIISPMFFNWELNPTGVFGWEYWYYYPLSFLWRASPVTLVGLVLLAIAFFTRRRFDLKSLPWREIGLLALFVLIFTLLMTASVKKFDRYNLPTILPLNLMAAAGFYAALKAGKGLIGKKSLRITASVTFLIVIFALQGLLVYQTFPYGLSYYNPLMGGGEKAPDAMMVGSGEGLAQAAEYMMNTPNKGRKVIYSFYSGVFGFHYYKQVNDMPWYEWDFTDQVFEADYWVLYLNQQQRGMSGPAFDYVEGHEPEYTVVINGIEYAWVYNLAEIRGD